jgi:hypothetical protein
MPNNCNDNCAEYLTHRQWPIMFQLYKCSEKQFCGNMRADYYFTYYQCSCPQGVMCLQKDHETYNVSELLYTGLAYKAICTPNWKTSGQSLWSFCDKNFTKCSISISLMWQNGVTVRILPIRRNTEIQTEYKTMKGIRNRKLRIMFKVYISSPENRTKS